LEYLGLYNKPKAEVHLGHKLTGPKEKEKQQQPSMHAKPEAASAVLGS
jgi:hypothetical protein